MTDKWSDKDTGEKWKDAVTGPIEGPGENVSFSGPFADKQLIITAEFEMSDGGNFGFVGEEFEANRIARRMERNMKEPDRLDEVRVTPDIMSITADVSVPLESRDADVVVEVLRSLNPKRVRFDIQ